jgi:hypothetical protein
MPQTKRRPRLVIVREHVLDETRLEVAALADAGREFATAVVALVRAAERLVAVDYSPGNKLDELERLALRHQAQMTSAAVLARIADRCPDTDELVNHGAAA